MKLRVWEKIMADYHITVKREGCKHETTINVTHYSEGSIVNARACQSDMHSVDEPTDDIGRIVWEEA